MPKLTGKDLGALYPQPKSYDQLREEQGARMVKHQPRFVEAKISAWTTLGTLAVLAVYAFASYTLADDHSSPTMTMFVISVSIIVVLSAGVSLMYFLSLINGLASRVFASTKSFHIMLSSWLILVNVILVNLIAWKSLGLLSGAAVLVGVFLAMYLSTRYLISRQK